MLNKIIETTNKVVNLAKYVKIQEEKLEVFIRANRRYKAKTLAKQFTIWIIRNANRGSGKLFITI